MKNVFYLLGFLVATALPLTAFADYTIQTGSDGAYGDSWGYSAAIAEFVEQPFTTTGAGDVSTIDIKAQSQGAPGNHAYLEIQTDSGGDPSGTVLGTSDLFNPVGAPGSVISVNFSTPVSLSASTNYHYVFKRDDALSVANYYDVRTGAGPGNDCQVYAAGAWIACYSTNPVFGEVFVVETGPAPVVTATSTSIDNPNQNLFNGFLIFFISMILPLWFFKKPIT